MRGGTSPAGEKGDGVKSIDLARRRIARMFRIHRPFRRELAPVRAVHIRGFLKGYATAMTSMRDCGTWEQADRIVDNYWGVESEEMA